MALQAEEKKRFEQIAKELRLTIIDVMAWSGGAHVGGSLSIVEILTLLYFKYLNIDPKNPKWEDRDRFILSKGHTAAGYIPVLAKRGYFDESCSNPSTISAAPSPCTRTATKSLAATPLPAVLAMASAWR